MARHLIEPKLVVASHNAGKVAEIRALLAPYGIETVSAKELDLAVPDETETSFAGNALIKARAAAQTSGLPALADDSGLEIDALDGAPGVYTADWAETPYGRDFQVAMTKAWHAVQESGLPPPYRAVFNACLALAWPDGHAETFLGQVQGTLTWPPRGGNGFGYDPMFVPDADPAKRTFGEMRAVEKEPLNHRTAAFAKLKACLRDPAQNDTGETP